MDQRSVDWINPAATMASTGVVAWIALSSYRSQKALDRRVDWYERTLTAVNALMYLLVKIKNRTDPDEIGKIGEDEVLPALHALLDLALTGRIYALSPTQAAAAAIFEITQSPTLSVLIGPTGAQEERRALIAQCMTTALNLRDAIIGDLHTLLPLRPRRERLWQKTLRAVGIGKPDKKTDGKTRVATSPAN